LTIYTHVTMSIYYDYANDLTRYFLYYICWGFNCY